MRVASAKIRIEKAHIELHGGYFAWRTRTACEKITCRGYGARLKVTGVRRDREQSVRGVSTDDLAALVLQRRLGTSSGQPTQVVLVTPQISKKNAVNRTVVGVNRPHTGTQ